MAKTSTETEKVYFAAMEYTDLDQLREAIINSEKYTVERMQRVMHYGILWEKAARKNTDDAGQEIVKHIFFCLKNDIPLEDMLKDYLLEAFSKILEGVSADAALNLKKRRGAPESDRLINQYWYLRDFEVGGLTPKKIAEQLELNEQLDTLLSEFEPHIRRKLVDAICAKYKLPYSLFMSLENEMVLKKTQGIDTKAVQNRLKKRSDPLAKQEETMLLEAALDRSMKYLHLNRT